MTSSVDLQTVSPRRVRHLSEKINTDNALIHLPTCQTHFFQHGRSIELQLHNQILSSLRLIYFTNHCLAGKKPIFCDDACAFSNYYQTCVMVLFDSYMLTCCVTVSGESRKTPRPPPPPLSTRYPHPPSFSLQQRPIIITSTAALL